MLKTSLLRFVGTVCVLLLVGCSGADTSTPLELAEGDALTSYDEMMVFFGRLEAETGAFTIDTIGTSLEGRSLVALHFSSGEGAGPSDKLKVLIYAQQHGNEPSGKEAAIALTRDIATGKFTDFLSSVDFYLIPQINPDGSEKRQRRNASENDLNRDHIALFTPEVQALHAFFNQIQPDVTLDVHEYGFASSSWVDAGFHKNFGQQIGALSNANMSLALRSYAWDRVIPEMERELGPKNVHLRRYLVTDGPDARFRYSTAALNDGRNSMGIYHSLSFLIEGMNGLTVESEIRERTRQQLETVKSFLGFFSRNASEVREMVGREKAALTGGAVPADVSLVMDYVPDPSRPTVSVGVIDLETGGERDLVIEDFHPQVQSTLNVRRPLGYVVPAGLTEVIAVLERHGVEMSRAETVTEATLESYRIEAVATATKEDKEFLDVTVSGRRSETQVQVGDVVVLCDQLATNLIVTLLEPQSQWGLAPLPEFVSMLAVGSEYPIKRIIDLPG